LWVKSAEVRLYPGGASCLPDLCKGNVSALQDICIKGKEVGIKIKQKNKPLRCPQTMYYHETVT